MSYAIPIIYKKKSMFDKLTLSKFSKSLLKSISEEAGIYIFFDEYKKPIYVGKAINLKKRLYSYTLRNLEPKTKLMVFNTVYLSIVKVTSEIEALLLEAKLVSKFRPKFNIQLKDDKSPLYVIITKDEYPRVLTARRIFKNGLKVLKTFGPFLTSENVYFILKTIRRVFPFATHKPEGKACFYSHLGLCDPCPSTIEILSSIKKDQEKKRYIENIKHIKKLLDGNVTLLTEGLTRDMRKYSENENFEMAEVNKILIEKIKNITRRVISGEHFIENPNLREDLRSIELNTLQKHLQQHLLSVTLNSSIKRIECFDIAHLSGKYPVASMVTFIDGAPNKEFYRHFKILQKKGNSDADSMTEVSKRRIKHFSDWGVPDLILVDGGRPQVSKFQSEFEKFNLPVVGIAKMSLSLVIPTTKKSNGKYVYNIIGLQNKKFMPLILRLKDEAHRFSRKLHHKLLQKSYNI